MVWAHVFCLFVLTNKGCRWAGILGYCVHCCYQVWHFVFKIETDLKISTSST